MKIIVATYNYYPFNWGGTEVYVDNLIRKLQSEKVEAIILASVPKFIAEGKDFLWKGKSLIICEYYHRDQRVWGVYSETNILEIYEKHSTNVEKDFKNFFLYLNTSGESTPDVLHLNCFTSVIGISLIRSFKDTYRNARIVCSYHTPISCPKNTLLYFNQRSCTIIPNIETCSSCIINDKINIPWVSKFISKYLIPNNYSFNRPNFLNLKFYVGKSISSFKTLISEVDGWWIFSEEIKKILTLNKIPNNKILLGRHGISNIYKKNKTLDKNSKKTIFGFVGRFKDFKGILTLIKSWKKLPIDNTRELWLIGSYSDKDFKIINEIKNLITREDVIFFGEKSQIEMIDIYSKMHCLIVPSEWIEIGPMVIHEAISQNVNIIGSNIGGVKELCNIYSNCAETFEFKNYNNLNKLIVNFKYKNVEYTPIFENEHFSDVVEWIINAQHKTNILNA